MNVRKQIEADIVKKVNHKIELSLLTDLEAAMKAGRQITKRMNAAANQLKQAKKEAKKTYDDFWKPYDAISQTRGKLSKQAKELGLDFEDSPKYKESLGVFREMQDSLKVYRDVFDKDA